MYKITGASVFNTDAKCITNAVNTVGVMSAGVALEFKIRYPEMFSDYLTLCENKQVQVGKPYLYNPNILIFPTKDHWKDKSKYEWIDQGMLHFTKNYKAWGITSIAFPKLGSENGGLAWNEVRKIMDFYLMPIAEDIDIFICEDTNEPEGIELLMLNYFKSKNEKFSELRRFRDLKRILTGWQYIEVFKKCYSSVNKSQEN